MAFTSSRRRYASFDTVASIPGEVIDAFWYIIDHQLKGVFTMRSVINFQLINSGGLLSIRYSQDNDPTTVTVDFDYPFDSAWPSIFHAVDNMGRETIVTDHEL
ncbi:DUF960 domain-containing protein [Lactococcus fujiensis]|uniref:DUF960 domain-containing protein n=1 Tax=Lactococcus fujiensis JCM 16395 TaxID=1291764 RepID=A0A2A5RKE5_9LACT|nr:DUF960 domain-containing protein [Lactococcus fujiensis]PCR99665.1 hypothetical protein RT41_GL001778 [Lactococcus fujiensis JCM 16395]